MVDPDNITSLLLDGKTVDAQVRDAITAATINRTITGASTLEVDVHDPDRKLVTSRLFANRVAATVDKVVFDLVQVSKGGSVLSLTFEDAVVADLRTDKTKPGQPTPSAKAGTTTIDTFARRLVAGAPGAKFVGYAGQKNLDALMRGSSSDRYEDSWTCLQRLADERGWRCFADRGAVYLGPDSWLLGRTPKTVVREYEHGVQVIDWDFDAGKRASRASFRVAASRWLLPPGSPVTVQEQGLGSGDWLVESTTRSLFDSMTEVNLIRVQAALPEPKPEPRDDGNASDGAYAAAGGKAVLGPVSAQGFQWPLSGPLTSGYGQRNGRLHAGQDIGVPVGTPVHAIADGTVVTASGGISGYGNAIYLSHAGGFFSRYGHVSKFNVRRGQVVKRGEQIALSGGAKGAPGSGDSTGPHLHLEIRPGNKPADPLKYLPSRR